MARYAAGASVQTDDRMALEFSGPFAVFAGTATNHAGALRALLDNMTTMSRLSPFFQETTVAEDATFFDLLKLLGFQSVTTPDCDKVTHQVTIK